MASTTLDWLTARPIAHRGLHDAARGVIENTAAAVRAAIAAGYGIEVDLQISADGEAMVHHDDVLGRLTDGEGRLDRLSAAELKRVAVPRQRRAHDDARRTVRSRRRARHLADRAEKPVRRRRAPSRSRGVGAVRLWRTGRADVVRSAAACKCCGKRPLACRAELLRPNTGRIPIGIRCRHGCVTAWDPCCRP